MIRVLGAAPVAKESLAINYYEASWVDRRWVITRRRDGHVFCICRSQVEAEQIAKMLNRDCARDPQHHGES
jgi:hypothetical protein